MVAVKPMPVVKIMPDTVTMYVQLKNLCPLCVSEKKNYPPNNSQVDSIQGFSADEACAECGICTGTTLILCERERGCCPETLIGLV